MPRSANLATDLSGLLVWVVEDHPGANEALVEIARGLGAEARGYHSAEAALASGEPAPAVVLTDLRLPGMDGLALLEALHGRTPAPETVVLTAHGSVDEAVRAMRLGAIDFLTKPLDLVRVEATLRGAAARARLRQELQLARAEARHLRGELEPVYRSAAFGSVVQRINRAAESTATVLIVGESGTGKERLARMVHEGSARSEGPFVPIHLAALAEGVLESELFGHERGAFTGAVSRRQGCFEAAHGGTLFLDEIGEIDPRTSVRLLRVLQERTLVRVGGNQPITVDTRLVCATNKDLEAEVKAGRFRADLFYRLDVVRVAVPPLRERAEDIPALIAHFVDRFSSRYGRPPPEIPAEVATALQRHDWPGNVRELENVIERLVVMTRGAVQLADLPARLASRPATIGALPEGDVDLPALLDEIERELVQRALRRAGGNRSQAARSLGITREGLRYKLQKFGLDDE